MGRQENIISDRICWVAVVVAIATLALLLWSFD